MIRKNTPKNTTLITLILFSILFFAKSSMYAQTIVPQSLSFPRICAGLIIDGKSFNEYNATFSYVDFPAGTTFEVQLSDELGSFKTPVNTTKISFVDNQALQQQTIKFAIPINLKGSDTQSIRIVSSLATTSVSPKFRNSQNETEFPIYYRTYVESFSINEKLATANICTGGSMNLSIYNPTPNDQASSPLNYPNLKYKWFKNDVPIAGQSGSTLVVNTPGIYFAQIDYGGCNDENFSSNRVTVTSAASGSSVTIVSSLGNPFCASANGTVLTATSGNSYVWKKDGIIITGATNRTYSANESGLYTVDVDFGGCKATGSIDLKNNGFTASIDVADEFKLKEGETLSVSVTTDATSPTYEWYLNNNLISGATTGSYLVAAIGTYKVKISQSSGCISSKEFIFKATGPPKPSSVIPNIISLSGASPYWNIPDEYKNANTKVMIISSNGDMVLDVNNYQGDWPQTSINFKNVNPVYYYVIKGDAGEKKGSITVIR